MNYLWEKFNIKTFSAETIVFVDGEYQPELSTLPNDLKIAKKYELPVHIIYVGEIAGENEINIEILAENQKVFLTEKITTKKPAFLNIFIKNTGKNSEFFGKTLVQNYGQLKIDIFCEHKGENTGLFIENRVIAHSNSDTKLSGIVKIEPNTVGCRSDMIFSALAAPDAKIQFSPAQKIECPPDSAGHSANLWRPTEPQIQYLRESGLSSIEVKTVLEEAFTNFD